jgi:hypothetical protein
MAKKLRIEFHSEGFQAVLNSEGVRTKLKQMAENVASAAGDGFEVTEKELDYGGSPRPGMIVSAETYEAKKAEATDKALTRAISAARG